MILVEALRTKTLAPSIITLLPFLLIEIMRKRPLFGISMHTKITTKKIKKKLLIWSIAVSTAGPPKYPDLDTYLFCEAGIVF